MSLFCFTSLETTPELSLIFFIVSSTFAPSFLTALYAPLRQRQTKYMPVIMYWCHIGISGSHRR